MTQVVGISSLGTNPHRSCATQVWEAFMRMRLPINRFFRPMSPSPKPPSMLAQGFLPAHCNPFSLGGDPSKPDFKVRNLRPPSSLTLDRVRRRREMQLFLDQMQRKTEGIAPQADPYDQQAYALLMSPTSQSAFHLEEEPASMRQRYGRSRVGTGCDGASIGGAWCWVCHGH